MNETVLTDLSIGKRIQELREIRNLRQSELAEMLRAAGVNWSQGTLSRVEGGERPVRLVEAPTVARVLRTKLYELVNSHLPVQSESDTKQRVRAALDMLDIATVSARQVEESMTEISQAVREVSMIFEDITESQEEGKQ